MSIQGHFEQTELVITAGLTVVGDNSEIPKENYDGNLCVCLCVCVCVCVCCV